MVMTCPLDWCVNTVYKFMMNETVKYADSSGRRRKHWVVNTVITGMWEIKARYWSSIRTLSRFRITAVTIA